MWQARTFFCKLVCAKHISFCTRFFSRIVPGFPGFSSQTPRDPGYWGNLGSWAYQPIWYANSSPSNETPAQNPNFVDLPALVKQLCVYPSTAWSACIFLNQELGARIRRIMISTCRMKLTMKLRMKSKSQFGRWWASSSSCRWCSDQWSGCCQSEGGPGPNQLAGTWCFALCLRSGQLICCNYCTLTLLMSPLRHLGCQLASLISLVVLSICISHRDMMKTCVHGVEYMILVLCPLTTGHQFQYGLQLHWLLVSHVSPGYLSFQSHMSPFFLIVICLVEGSSSVMICGLPGLSLICPPTNLSDLSPSLSFLSFSFA